MPRLAATNRDDVLSETRQRLLDAAATEFADKGFAGANINRISTEAGFAKGTVYNYFPSKRELMLALIDEVGANHSGFIQQRVDVEVEPERRLEQFFGAGYAFVEAFPAEARVSITAVFGHDAEFKQRIFEAYEALFAFVTEEIIEHGRRRGAFRPTDADLATALLMSLYLGSCSLLDPTGKIWLNPKQVLSFVLHGLGHPDGVPQSETQVYRPVQDTNWKQW